MHTVWHRNQIWGLLMHGWKKETSLPISNTLGSSSGLSNDFIRWINPKWSWPLQKTPNPYTHTPPPSSFYSYASSAWIQPKRHYCAFIIYPRSPHTITQSAFLWIYSWFIQHLLGISLYSEWEVSSKTLFILKLWLMFKIYCSYCMQKRHRTRTIFLMSACC